MRGFAKAAAIVLCSAVLGDLIAVAAFVAAAEILDGRAELGF
ncbi:hypothetical protein [Mycolicibacterium canariasense]|nr:hypothetical protein [Mycolicibacterium canariasense]